MRRESASSNPFSGVCLYGGVSDHRDHRAHVAEKRAAALRLALLSVVGTLPYTK